MKLFGKEIKIAHRDPDRKTDRNTHKSAHRNTNRVSCGIGTAIVILLAFSCVVGADSFLADSSVKTEGENYDMVTPDYYTFSENDAITAGTVTDPSEVATDATEETTLPEATESETSAAETTLETALTEATSDPSDTTAADPTAPSEPVATPTPTHVPTPTATPFRPTWTWSVSRRRVARTIP